MYEKDQKQIAAVSYRASGCCAVSDGGLLGKSGRDCRPDGFSFRHCKGLSLIHICSQNPGCSAFVIGEPGLFNALHDAGITINTVDPDYVIVGETNNYNYDSICRAVQHVLNGSKLIGTNTDLTAPLENGIVPACRALNSPNEMATGKSAYYLGKPNPLMMRT